MWRLLYAILWRLTTPLIKHYLRKRARKAPAYLEHWDERFGTALQPRQVAPIWIHAVSVGETRAAQPLIQALRQQWPDAPLLLTQMTPTGRDCAQALYGDQAEIRYLPYDYPQAMADFLRAYRPRFGILMETELWPHLIAAAARLQVPLFLANARLSDKSLRGYLRFAGLFRPVMRQFSAIAAQTEADATRLQQLGAIAPQVCGNTKYDFQPPRAMQALGAVFKSRIGSRLVVVCASTRDGEEALILQAWCAAAPEALLVLVPRHPERFAEVAQLGRQMGLCVQLRSDQQPLAAETQLWVGDSMGELFAYYHAADLVFIGGSLLPLGGQNLIEPASVGKPVLMGPSCYNFAEASQHAFACGAARQVKDATDLVVQVKHLLADPQQRSEMAQAGLAFSQAHQGASLRIVQLIATQLSVGK